jgi:hypothetical protein
LVSEPGRVAAFGEGVRTEETIIPIGRLARYVIVAHRLMDTDLFQGGPVGKPCAEYGFRYTSGDEVNVAVRERFEIGTLPQVWGNFPFLAYPDQKDGMVTARYEGKWQELGMRQSENTQGWPQCFFLWTWVNPRPDLELGALIIRPKGPRFVIGAVTLGHLEEFPFNRSARREVKIVLPAEANAKRPFNLEVEVDRGVASYPFALPQQDAEAFLADGYAGYGQEQNSQSSPAFVEIAAVPSATVIVKQDGETLGAVNWGELETNKLARPNQRLELILLDEGRNWVKTTVLDDATGRPVPCRVHFRSRDGVPFPPHGHHAHVNSNLGSWHIDVGGDVRLGQMTYAYVDGTCEGWLPRGEVLVDIARGPEYEPIRTRVEVAPGQQELTFRLKRLRDMGKEGWYSGDTHVHFLSTQGAHTEAAGEGLNLVNLLLSQWGHLFTNAEEFTGEPSVQRGGETIVWASQENRQHMLGHLALLGLKRPVNPWCSDGPMEAEIGGNLETSMSRWADACHAQGGTVVLPHMPWPNGETATLITTGRIDAAEWLAQNDFGHIEYYRYLNCGYRLPLAGGTDKMTSGVPVGLYRTYVYLDPDQPFTHENWCRGLKAGRTFLSGGPLLRFSVDGVPIGGTLDLPGNGGTVEVTAEAESVLPIHTLEVVMNGQVIARTEEKTAAKRLSVRAQVKVEKHSWLVARCAGPGYGVLPHRDDWGRGILAHTSPVYVAVGGPWWRFELETANYLLTLIHGGMEYIRHRALQWRPEAVTHHHGREDHLTFLEEPFRQAIEAIHKRMHELDIKH